ncbi:unnamed protein product [Mytilus edulis]|uniref:Ig-like domain-containing protein n=1 Tax=Mytilus edulis TaxID=6550 RepID=A0A8S3RZH0_MYTED|nr:unnamed protein product [Mytilus edulis]
MKITLSLVISKQVAIRGHTVLLICPFRKQTDPIQWERHKGIYSEDEHINPALDTVIKTRLHVEGSQLEGQFNLQMRNVSKKDEGTYTCLTKINGSGVVGTVYLEVIAKPLWTTGDTSFKKATKHWSTDEMINSSETAIDIVDTHGGNYNDALSYKCADASSHNNIAIYVICIVCTIIVTTMLNVCFRYLPHKEMCQIHGNGRSQNLTDSSNQNISRVLENEHLGQINAYDEIDETAMTAMTMRGMVDRIQTSSNETRSSNETSSSNEEDISGSGYLHPYQSIIAYIDVHTYAKCTNISNIKRSSNSLPASLKGLSNISSKYFTKERDQKYLYYKLISEENFSWITMLINYAVSIIKADGLCNIVYRVRFKNNQLGCLKLP